MSGVDRGKQIRGGQEFPSRKMRVRISSGGQRSRQTPILTIGQLVCCSTEPAMLQSCSEPLPPDPLARKAGSRRQSANRSPRRKNEYHGSRFGWKGRYRLDGGRPFVYPITIPAVAPYRLNRTDKKAQQDRLDRKNFNILARLSKALLGHETNWSDARSRAGRHRAWIRQESRARSTLLHRTRARKNPRKSRKGPLRGVAACGGCPGSKRWSDADIFPRPRAACGAAPRQGKVKPRPDEGDVRPSSVPHGGAGGRPSLSGSAGENAP